MITISILGLDQFVTGQYSKDHTRNIADIFEISPDDLLFYAPNSYVFHNGVEQTSWNGIVRVNAPKEYKKFQDRIAKYLLTTLCDYCINIYVEFYYFDSDDSYLHISSDYPRFITEENMVSMEEEIDVEDSVDDFISKIEKNN